MENTEGNRRESISLQVMVIDAKEGIPWATQP
jgi:hypothetical protein